MQKITFTTEEIEQACVTVIGDGQALDLIVGNLHRAGRSTEIGFKPGDIVISRDFNEDVFFLEKDGTSTEETVTSGITFKVISIEGGVITCKAANGVIAKLTEEQIDHASHMEREEYSRVQIHAIRNAMAPILNYFIMKNMAKTVKDQQSKDEIQKLVEQGDEQALMMVDAMKNLW